VLRLSACAAGAAVFLGAPPVRAVDPFEIQVYDGEANRPGEPGLELHVNHVASGASHFTLEPSFGVLPWWEIGGYFQTALRADGHFDYAGVKLRSKFVGHAWSEHLRAGLNVEVSLIPTAYDPNRWGMEFRPIVAWEDERYLFALNPIVDAPLAGPDFRAGPHFEPAAMAKAKIMGLVAIGFEYYAGLGPFAGLLPLREQEQYLYEAVDVLGIPNLELNVGLGEGWTEASESLVFKCIVGYTFAR
jgi:hypothetical protein